MSSQSHCFYVNKVSNSNTSTTANNTTTAATSTEDSLFDIKIEIATDRLIPYYSRRLLKDTSNENALTIAKYIFAMKTEFNLSDHYRQGLIQLLSKLSIFCNSKDNNNNDYNNTKSFKRTTRQDILAFLDIIENQEKPIHSQLEK